MQFSIAIGLLAMFVDAPAAGSRPGPDETTRRIITACGAEVDSEAALRALPRPARDRKLACLLREIARGISKDLPRTTGEATFAGISSEGLTLAYRHIVHGDTSNPDPARLAAIPAAITTQLCSGPFMRSMISMGASVVMRVHDDAGRLLSETRISRCPARP